MSIRGLHSLLSMVLLTVLAWPRLSTADEGESAISVSMAFGGFSIPDHSPVGGVLGIDYEHGLTDVIWLRASAGGGVFYDSGSPAYAGHSVLGLTYVIDVLKYVPYVNLGIGGVVLHGNRENGTKKGEIGTMLEPLVELGVGLDVLNRETSYGVFARFESFLGRTALFNVGARMSWRWGFF